MNEGMNSPAAVEWDGEQQGEVGNDENVEHSSCCASLWRYEEPAFSIGGTDLRPLLSDEPGKDSEPAGDEHAVEEIDLVLVPSRLLLTMDEVHSLDEEEGDELGGN